MRPWLAGYLVGWLFWLSISLGSVGLLQTHALTGGLWGGAARRAWQTAAGLMPWLALLFVPVLAGVGRLYPWTGPGRHGYLTVGFFVFRAAVYLACWIVLARLARRPARDALSAAERFPTAAAGLGLVAFVLSATFASFDWMATLEPRWTSTVFGLTFIAGCGLAALALGAILAGPAGAAEPARHDIGNLLLAFTMLWAYCAFSQWLVIWSGDIPREISWYVDRTRHGWQAVAVILAFGHFFLPFGLLLWRRIKRGSVSLSAVGALVLAGCWLDLCWMVAPTVSPESLRIGAHALLGSLVVGAAWLFLFRRGWRAAPAREAA